MHKEKIICGFTDVESLKKLNDDIDRTTREEYKAIDISGTGDPDGEICVLLCKKV